jgi:uncharacterized C2H2 Zn-finger protein
MDCGEHGTENMAFARRCPFIFQEEEKNTIRKNTKLHGVSFGRNTPL